MRKLVFFMLMLTVFTSLRVSACTDCAKGFLEIDRLYSQQEYKDIPFGYGERRSLQETLKMGTHFPECISVYEIVKTALEEVQDAIYDNREINAHAKNVITHTRLSPIRIIFALTLYNRKNNPKEFETLSQILTVDIVGRYLMGLVGDVDVSTTELQNVLSHERGITVFQESLIEFDNLVRDYVKRAENGFDEMFPIDFLLNQLKLNRK